MSQDIKSTNFDVILSDNIPGGCSAGYYNGSGKFHCCFPGLKGLSQDIAPIVYLSPALTAGAVALAIYFLMKRS